MALDRGVVRHIDWRSLCPWLIIFRTFRLATSLPILFLATAATVLVPLSWRCAEMVCVDDESRLASMEFRRVLEINRAWPGERGVVPAPDGGRTPRSVRDILWSSTNLVEVVYFRMISPVRAMLGGALSFRQWCYYAMGMVFTLAIWGLLGGVITRMAVVRLGREEKIAMGEAMRFAVSRFWSYFASPLFPLLGVVLLSLPLIVAGLLMRLDFGVAIVGILWVFALLCGLAIAVILLGLVFGWPLMWGAISSEATGDAFEAFSRSYSYTFQRPLHYLFYALVATTFGAFCWLLVYHFSEAVIWFTDWAVALGAGDRWHEIANGRHGGAGTAVGTGLVAMDCWNGLVRTMATAFGYSFFWCVAAALYLLLRRGVDQTDFDEIFVENEDDTFQLPDLNDPKASLETNAAHDQQPQDTDSGKPARPDSNENGDTRSDHDSNDPKP